MIEYFPSNTFHVLNKKLSPDLFYQILLKKIVQLKWIRF